MKKTLKRSCHSLRRIETVMQRMELSLLTALSGNLRSLIPEVQPVVLSLTVSETILPSRRIAKNCPRHRFKYRRVVFT